MQPAELSIVIIGKNVGLTLKRCCDSVQKLLSDRQRVEFLYVDSLSTDDSVEIAQKMGAKVLTLDSEEVPTAARARNMGWEVAKGKIILFLDGDTELCPDFVASALPHFNQPKVAVVCGERIEKFPNKNFFHRVFNLDWKLPRSGEQVCGGDALILREALERVGGFDSNLKGGEEPELCSRLHEKGYLVIALEDSITIHDLQMDHFYDYWKRCQRTGYAYAEVASKTGSLWKKQVLHTSIKGVLVIFTLLLIPFTHLLFVILLALMIRTALLTWKVKKADGLTAFYYGIHAHLQHIPMFIGCLQYWLSEEQPFITKRGLKKEGYVSKH